MEKPRWPWHSFKLPSGEVLQGHTSLEWQARLMAAVPSPAGKTVLDMGGSDGYYSFECARLGASRVVLVDNEMYAKNIPFASGVDWFPDDFGGETFRYAQKYIYPDVNIEYVKADFMTLDPAVYKADIVLFLGIYYHLKNPWTGFDKVAELAREAAVIEGHCISGSTNIAEFYEGSELNNDPTNWWGPTKPCLKAMIRAAGFREVEEFPHNRALMRAVK